MWRVVVAAPAHGLLQPVRGGRCPGGRGPAERYPFRLCLRRGAQGRDVPTRVSRHDGPPAALRETALQVLLPPDPRNESRWHAAQTRARP
jgi:hypothetical protein